MKIRPATIRDASAFAEISGKTFALACPPNTTKEDLDSYIQSELTLVRFEHAIKSPSKIFFAVEVDDQIAGYVMLSKEQAPPSVVATNPLEIQRIYVLPHYHGSGAAKLLFETAIAFAEDNAHDVLWLGVSKHNQRGRAFYKKHDFTVVGEQNFPVGQDIHEDWIMSRPVNTQTSHLPNTPVL